MIQCCLRKSWNCTISSIDWVLLVGKHNCKMQYFSTFPSSPLFSSQPNKKKWYFSFFFSSLFFQDPFLTSFFLKWKIVVLGITSNLCMVIRSFYTSEAYCSIYTNVAKVHAKMMMVMMNRNPNECPSAFWICPKSS